MPTKPPSDSVTFIISMREPFHFLYERIGRYDQDRFNTYCILQHLVADVIETEQMRDPVGSYFQQAQDEMQMLGMSVNESYAMAVAVGDEIIKEMINVIPNWGSDVYHNAYEYFLRSPHDVYLSVQRSVFQHDAVPPSRTRPYRL